MSARDETSTLSTSHLYCRNQNRVNFISAFFWRVSQACMDGSIATQGRRGWGGRHAVRDRSRVRQRSALSALRDGATPQRRAPLLCRAGRPRPCCGAAAVRLCCWGEPGERRVARCGAAARRWRWRRRWRWGRRQGGRQGGRWCAGLRSQSPRGRCAASPHLRSRDRTRIAAHPAGAAGQLPLTPKPDSNP
mgnify:CR=1 FL=1